MCDNQSNEKLAKCSVYMLSVGEFDHSQCSTWPIVVWQHCRSILHMCCLCTEVVKPLEIHYQMLDMLPRINEKFINR